MFNALFTWVIGKAKDYLLKNWKTTVIGLLGGLLVKYIPDAETRTAVLAGIVAALGLVAKDGDKSGTTEQPRLDPVSVKKLAPVVEGWPEAPAPAPVDYGSGG
jgi:hypothetical protein